MKENNTKLTKKDEKIYWRYAIIFGLLLCGLNIIVRGLSIFFAQFFERTLWIQLIYISISLILLYGIMLMSIVRIETKVKTLNLLKIMTWTLVVFVGVRQLIGITFLLVKGEPWSFLYLIPQIGLLEILSIFIVPAIYMQLRKIKVED